MRLRLAPLMAVAAVLALTACAAGPQGRGPAAGGAAQPAGPRLEDFPPLVEIAPEAIAADLDSHPKARRFRTMIREGAAAGAAYAGHLAVASWGCGTECQQHVFIDARNGRVIWGPQTSFGARYVQHSRLFIANPPENMPEQPGAAAVGTEYYVWTGDEIVPLAAAAGR